MKEDDLEKWYDEAYQMCKSPSKDEAGAEDAYNQLRNYMQDIPSLFIYNAICVISDLSTNKAGTITSGFRRQCREWQGSSAPASMWWG